MMERVEVVEEVDGVRLRALVAPDHAEMARTVVRTMLGDGLDLDPGTGRPVVARGIDRVRDGAVMGWGFAAVMPRPIGAGDYELVTTDYLATPLALTPDLTAMLGLRRRMQGVCAAAGLLEEATAANDRVILVRGWEHEPELVLLRDPVREGDSGWFVQPASQLPPEEGWRPEQLVAHLAWEVLRERPALVAAMSLPVGCIVRVSGERIVGIRDVDDRELPVGDEAAGPQPDAR